MDYQDHSEVLKVLKKDQHAEEDLREQITEIIHFLHHPQGQWEPNVWKEYNGRPRYTFDQCKPAISKVWSEMAANEYSATTQPIGGGASEDVSNIIDGLFRSIYNSSSFDDISTKAGKRMIGTAFACWRIVAKYVEDCFYQELRILPVNNCHQRVWFDCNSEMQTREDAMHVNVLSNMGIDAAKRKWPKRDGVFLGVDDARHSDAYTYKPADNVLVGEILYKKPAKKTIYLLDDDSNSVVDSQGLINKGLTPDNPLVLQSREMETFEVWSRKYDGKDWLEDAKKTVFSYLPIIPEYANFDVSEDGKVTYEGLIRPVMDHQRVFNYVESRKVEESVLAPRAKVWLDDRAAEGYADELADLNRDPKAVQLYNGKGADEAQGHPFLQPTPGPQPNPALTEISNDMIRNMQLTLGLPNELEIMQNTRKDSDFRFDQRGTMGQMGTFEYYRSHKVALEHTAKVMLDAIPKVYDTERKIRVIDEAGQSSEEAINSKDRATGDVINDLTVGKYDICVRVGPTFESRKNEANTKILELGAINPDVVIRNTDIIASNIDAPGMRTVADRERAFLLKQGLIPESQLTDEERERLMMEAQNQQPDPASLIAQAELLKAQTEQQTAQFKALEAQAKLELQKSKQDAENIAKAVDLELKAQTEKIDNLLKLIQGAKLYSEMQINESSNEFDQQQRLIDRKQDELNGGRSG